jgi:hypothetical protein
LRHEAPSYAPQAASLRADQTNDNGIALCLTLSRNTMSLRKSLSRTLSRMTGNTPPFAAFEWMIAWRYLRARRAEGGVSAMTIISFLGIMLAVFALIATLSVRSGFRAEFVDTILGANAHVTLYSSVHVDEGGRTSRVIEDYEEMAERLAQVRGVTRVAPLIRGQVMASSDGRNTGIEVFGIHYEDLLTIPRVADPEQSLGDISRFTEGVAIGSGVARELNLSLGDSIRVISPMVPAPPLAPAREYRPMKWSISLPPGDTTLTERGCICPLTRLKTISTATVLPMKWR